LSVGNENIARKRAFSEQFMIEASGDEGEDILSQDDATAENLYVNFLLL
jgi:hypothetical protein